MLSKKLRGMSIAELLATLKKPRKQKFSVKKETEILDLIDKKRTQNSDFADKLIKSKFYKLASKQLEREKIPKQDIIIDKCHCLVYDPSLVMLKMYDITEKISHNKKIKELLKGYIKQS